MNFFSILYAYNKVSYLFLKLLNINFFKEHQELINSNRIGICPKTVYKIGQK